MSKGKKSADEFVLTMAPDGDGGFFLLDSLNELKMTQSSQKVAKIVVEKAISQD